MNIQRNVVLAPYTTFGIGGSADYFYKAESVEELIEAVKWASEPTPDVKRTDTSGVLKPIPFFILGSGANILIGDKGFRGLVIKNETHSVILGSPAHGTTPESLEETDSGQARMTNKTFLAVESGVTIEELIKVTAEKGLSGLEHFAGIPSTLGGALWQNLHFLSADRKETVFIGDLVESAEIYSIRHSGEHSDSRVSTASNETQGDSGQARITVNRDYFKFSYDYSSLHDNKDIVLSATLQLTFDDPSIIQKRIDANIRWREEKHPEYGWRISAGSVFKKIENAGAGRLIEKVGLKGHQIGGAQISLKHANFIINTGGAKAADVRALIDLVQSKVKKELGYTMKTEISFVGEF